MRIVNPAYDPAFKYLMDSPEIAMGFISAIIGEEIVEIETAPQEVSVKMPFELPTLLRLDFRAKIKTQSGELKVVMIELQKARAPLDIQRFRRYLGQQYSKTEEIKIEKGKYAGEYEKESLPIVTIYFLGFDLLGIESAAIKVGRVYQDLIENKIIEQKNEFVEKLTHDCYIIQIHRLHKPFRSDLEKFLSIFDQDFCTFETSRILDYPEPVTNPLLKKMVDKLAMAVQNPDLQEQMLAAEEFEVDIRKLLKEPLEKLEAAEMKLEAAETQLQEKDRLINEKDRLMAEMQKELEALKAQNKNTN